MPDSLRNHVEHNCFFTQVSLMEKHQDTLRRTTIAVFCLLCIGFGLYAWQMPMLIGGVLGMVYTAVATTMRLRYSAQPAEAPLPLRSPP